jgi:membrane-bound serine protease (ClpP class)
LKVYIVPIQENIMPPLVYVVRRGVKEAMEAKADLLILDMKTDGGRVDVTEEIIQIISNFPGLTVTYVNDRAFSAGAFIAVATQKIYMAPQSVIGAAAPIMMAPGGVGTGNLPDTMEVKMTSAIRALVRVQAEKNGHNIEVVEAMIDKTKELTMDGEVLNHGGIAGRSVGKTRLCRGATRRNRADRRRKNRHLDQRHRTAVVDHRNSRPLH